MRRALLSCLLLLVACRDAGDDSGKDPVVDDTGPVVTGTDGDGDGFSSDVDCNDADVTIYPGAGEVCDGIDNNCNGEVDEGLLSTWYLDADGDGHGNPDTETEACNEPDGHVAEGGDCNDLDDTVHPDALELCDGFDNDCDGTTDEGDASDVVTWYLDSDGDGFGVDDTTETACDGPAGYALVGGDCDDADPAFHPGASESDCTDPLDYNCDGSVGFADTDGDGFAACEDCDDSDAAVNDDAIETCDSVDNDCDGLVDSDDPDTVGTTVFYGDSDGDGYGGQQYQLDACEAAPGYVGNSDDCDDLDATSYPGAPEVCDSADNDCDGLTDDDDTDVTNPATWYADTDSDGYGDPGSSVQQCEMPSGSVSDSSDCDDSLSKVHPGAPETCEGLDNDCDGHIVSGWQDDADGDGIVNCIDSSIYSQDFESGWDDWTTEDLGGGNAPNWSITSGYLYEGSNAALSYALSGDLGEVDQFTISVEIFNNTNANNHSGIVFGYTGPLNYWYLRWSDPTNYYGSGADLKLIQVVMGASTTVTQDDGSVQLYTATAQWIPLTVQVTESEIIGTWNGIEIIRHVHGMALPLGLDQVGLTTFDNDGGVYYDNLVITNP